jgi:hypothetical protein
MSRLLIAGVCACAASVRAEVYQVLITPVSLTIAPGETITVAVGALHDIGCGTTAVWNTLGGSGQTGPYVGLYDALFDVLGSASPGVVATWSNLQLEPGLNGPGTSPGAVSGLDVSNIKAWVGFGAPACGSKFPPYEIKIWHADLTIGAASAPGTITLSSHVDGGVGYAGMFSGGIFVDPPGLTAQDAWETFEGQAVITIVPAPPVVVGATMMLAWRRGLSRDRRGALP